MQKLSERKTAGASDTNGTSRTTDTTGRPSRETPPSGAVPFFLVLGVVLLATVAVLTLYGNGRDPNRAERGDPHSVRSTSRCPIPATHDTSVTTTVYRIGKERGVPAKVMLAAFEVGWVESHMHNLSCGDRDSLGVFQQRPSQGWGTATQVRDVEYATNTFFDAAKEMHRKFPRGTAGELAQHVQRSAYPRRYDRAEPKARRLLSEARTLVDESS